MMCWIGMDTYILEDASRKRTTLCQVDGQWCCRPMKDSSLGEKIVRFRG